MNLAGVDLVSIPILVALARKPMGKRELARVTGASMTTIKRWCNHLEDLGVIVRRWDEQYQLVVVLRVEKLPSIVDGQLKVGEPGAQVFAPDVGVATEPLVREDAISRVQVPQVEARPAAAPQVIANAPKRVPVSNHAKAVAQRLRVPEWRRNMGEVGTGPVGKCTSCNTSTVIKYGGTPVCPACARK